MTTDNLKFHSAKEIKEDIDKGDHETAGAKLFEDYKASASSFKSVAEDLKKMTGSDKNWNNDVEITTDKGGDIKEIHVKTVPFTGNAFAPKVFDKDDEQNANPASNLEAWHRMAVYKNHIDGEKH
jgi:hypothetical protein